MSDIPELKPLETKVNRLQRVLMGDAEEGLQGVLSLSREVKAELERQKDDSIEGTMAYNIKQMQQERRDQRILIRGLMIGLGLIGIGGGVLQGVILAVLRELANRGL